MIRFTATQKYEEALREIKYRRWVYPKLVEQKKLTQASADLRIAIMEEIAADYSALATKEQLL